MVRAPARRPARRCAAAAADVATLEDRVRLASGRKQIYGTQLVSENGLLRLAPMEDSAHVELRRDAAVHQLCGTRLSIAEIASALGFQETSAFHRAFKRWSGVQPGEYRRRAEEQGPGAPAGPPPPPGAAGR